MSAVVIPTPLHDVLGERQTRLSIAVIAGVAVVATLATAQALADVALWRALVAALLIADIGAGAVANLTKGTNDYYAARPRQRWVFIAVHIHLPCVALLLALPLLPALLAWGMTITAAIVVNALHEHPDQRVLAGALLAVVGCALPFLPAQQPVLLVVSALFAAKVAYAFAVDHRGPTRTSDAPSSPPAMP